ncbi:hypothetical protein GCM10008096_21870 [Zhihengliuella salsuginis]|uniref:Uncharacterized protein n=1 Tax=Zhihengliuella salsuginis TaxID=578222 RepID=A0ABQ3GIQ3_9MICC|nr:hypothetical protein GCM10008096_21870 [Zhihengliuella salsuginis]
MRVRVQVDRPRGDLRRIFDGEAEEFWIEAGHQETIQSSTGVDRKGFGTARGPTICWNMHLRTVPRVTPL